MTLTTERLKWLHDAATELSATKLKMTMRPDELLVLTSELLANREAQPVAYPAPKDTSQGWKIDPEYLHSIADAVGSSDDEGAPSMELVEAVLLAAAPPAPAIPDIGSSVVNDAAWKLHDTLTEHGPLNGHKFNNLKGCLFEALKIVMSAPPAPAVPGIDELRLTFERSERESHDGFNLHKYGIGYADEATQARWESWLACRAAMLNHVGDTNEKVEQQNEPQNIPNNIPEGLAAAVNRLLDCDGTRGKFSAIRCSDAREEVERLLAQPVSQRYKLVPVEPTAEMIQSGVAAHYERQRLQIHDRPAPGPIECAYIAMLAAAPEGGN
ncbi:hypothetical protein [Serratia marcescens]|uniref:hypothetical protein n=1 Tax=Serratia marcescens TaxID=615 RepID=UPI0024A73298|nr:hypothetical protein [Serratia marcescens]